jgi:hypothetical protein
VKTAALVLMAFWLGAAPRALAAEAKISTATYPLPPGGHVSVINVRGTIQVEGWDRSMVELRVLKTAPDGCGCLDKAAMIAVPAEGGWSFHTLYLEDTRQPVQVDYQLMVPRQVHLGELRTVQGEIVVRDVEGSVMAETLDGDIREVGVAGQVSARSLNGNIEVSLRRLPLSGSGLSFETVNGSVDLTLPPRPNADLELSTVEGNVVTPYALQVSSHPGDLAERCELGRGGLSIQLKTIRGNIHVAERHQIL